MGAIVGLMSQEELDRGLELARLAGELWTVGDLAEVLDMPVLARIPRSARHAPARDRRRAVAALHEHARAAGAIKQTGKAIEAAGENEIAEGAVRLAASAAAAERSAELAMASDILAAQGSDEFATARWQARWRSRPGLPVWLRSQPAPKRLARVKQSLPRAKPWRHGPGSRAHESAFSQYSGADHMPGFLENPGMSDHRMTSDSARVITG